MTGRWGGLARRRPDQFYGPPAAAVPPGQRSTLRARTLIIQGAGGGIFVYDATQNLRTALAGAATTDPIQGLACPSGQSFWNGKGAILTVISNDNDAIFLYRDLGTAVQGGMIFAAASAAGNDPVKGTAYTAGQTNIDPAFADSINIIGATVKLQQLAYSRQAQIGANTGAGATSPFIQVDAPEQGVATHMQMKLQGTSPDGTHLGQVLIGQVAGGGGLAPQTDGMLEVQGQVANPADSIVQVVSQAAGDNSLGVRASGDGFNRLRVDTNAGAGNRPQLRFGSGAGVQDCNLRSPAANLIDVLTADFAVKSIGRGLQVATGANAKMGTAVLVAGTVTVANTSVTASSLIIHWRQVAGGALGQLSIGVITAGVSFVINSSSATDTSTIGYLIMEPA